MTPTAPIYFSDDNGQMACEECRPLYGRIPWHRKNGSEQVSMRVELPDILEPDYSLCEMRRGRVAICAVVTVGVS